MKKQGKGSRKGRELPKVNRFGFVIIGGYRWGTASALGNLLKVARSTVERRLVQAKSHMGIDPRGRQVRLYSERAARGSEPSKQPRAGRLHAAQRKMLKRYASGLVRVLYALSERQTDVTSITFLVQVLEHMSESGLGKAIERFDADGDLTEFLKLFP